MKILIYGATGMIGAGVLRECLLAEDVELVQTVGRRKTGISHARLREIVLPDLHASDAMESELRTFDACFFCLGLSSVGMSEADYTALTFDLTLSIANMLSRLNPQMTFVYVSGAGTDSTEQGRSMWARVKGRTENALRRLPFRAVYLFRPGVIQPLYGIRSKTQLYQWGYTLVRPLWPLLRLALGNKLVTTEDMGLAMLAVARNGAAKAILEASDVHAIAEAAA